MSEHSIKTIAIVGGGTAGWMSAAALSRTLQNNACTIYLIESKEIGTLGVGEATIPPIRTFNHALGIDENDFVQKTHATFKLGIEFVHWRHKNHAYMHPFSEIGRPIDNFPFHHYWQKLRQKKSALPLTDYALSAVSAYAGKFTADANLNTPLQYAYHLDATRYAQYLRNYCESRGVIRLEDKVNNVKCNPENGHIQTLHLDSGQELSADFYIDCSGFKGLLIEDALHSGYESWGHYLPCDKAIVIASKKSKVTRPYTQAIAHSAGWQWRIPLQHQDKSGLVFSSHHLSHDEAVSILMSNLEGPSEGDPREIKFSSGIRKKPWNKNCVAIGLSAGFMEPLESTGIHLIQRGILRLIEMLPDLRFCQTLIDKYNQNTRLQSERIRDFLMLHYWATERDDSEFWRDWKHQALPISLTEKIQLYKTSGFIAREYEELFDVPNWLAVLEGQGIQAESYHPIVDVYSDRDVSELLNQYRRQLENFVAKLPTHDTFLSTLNAKN